jgi:hypothetical protein
MVIIWLDENKNWKHQGVFQKGVWNELYTEVNEPERAFDPMASVTVGVALRRVALTDCQQRPEAEN